MYLQPAGALSASQGRVMWPTKGRLRDKLWDDWGTNRTVTVWQTMQVLSDKLTSRCVTSYLSAFGDKQNRLLCNKSLFFKLPLRCQQVLDALCDQPKGDCVTSYGMTEAQTEQSLCDKLCSHYLTNKLVTSRCVTSYPSALVTSKADSYATSRFITSCRCAVSKSRRQAFCDQPKGWSTNRTVTVWQTMQVLSDKLTSRCVTSYLSALVTSKKDPYATSRFITSCRCVVSKPRTRYVTNRDKLWDDWGTNRITVWQIMQLLSHKLTGRCVTSYPCAFARTNQGTTAWQAMGWLRHKQKIAWESERCFLSFQLSICQWYMACPCKRLPKIALDSWPVFFPDLRSFLIAAWEKMAKSKFFIE